MVLNFFFFALPSIGYAFSSINVTALGQHIFSICGKAGKGLEKSKNNVPKD